MTVHHLITEHHQRHICIYCKSTSVMDWNSEFYKSMHYKTSVCSCGKRLRIKVNFQGSGHDEWGIENKINQELKKITTS